MEAIKNSELVTKGNCVYHLNLSPEELGDNIILVGDPNRVAHVSHNFDTLDVIKQNREIVTHTGTFNNKRVTAMSTGMGTDNIDIVVNELNILANFNLKTKEPNPERKKLNIIRMGTCGALQPEIPLGTFIVSQYSIGMDGLLNFYDVDDSIFESMLANSFSKAVDWGHLLPAVYACKASDELLKRCGTEFYRGITLTAPGFYGPQWRNVGLPVKYPEIFTKLQNFSYSRYKITNMEMETSALYGLGQALGHNTLTICIAIANRTTGEFIDSYFKPIRKLAEKVLTLICK